MSIIRINETTIKDGSNNIVVNPPVVNWGWKTQQQNITVNATFPAPNQSYDKFFGKSGSKSKGEESDVIQHDEVSDNEKADKKFIQKR